MQEYGETTEQQSVVGAWLCDYAESRQPFDEIKHRHTLKEVGDVAEGKYDWKIKKIQDGLTIWELLSNPAYFSYLSWRMKYSKEIFPPLNVSKE